MCGIVGAIEARGSVLHGMLEGLRRLEYRGYDSAGVAVVEDGAVLLRKRQGRLENLEAVLADGALGEAQAGIGHTRWATHGPPSDRNAHPHTDAGDRVAVVHNGIIENHRELARELEEQGVVLRSDTDTEVLAHLIEREWLKTPELAEALRRVLRKIQGYYALAVLASGPDGPEIVCARAGPPLLVAVTSDAAYLASDVLGLIGHTDQVCYLEDGDVAVISPGKCELQGEDGQAVERPFVAVEWDATDIDRGEWPHHMLKEIHEQPDVLARTAFSRIDDGEGDVRFEDELLNNGLLADVARIQILGCGTALHAGLIASYLIEGLAGVPVDVDFASEFRYRNPRLVPGTVALAISQSGETADTLAASRLARELGTKVVAICNVDGSSQVREADAVILTQAGPEIGVASTKAFTAQVVAATLLAIRIGRARGFLPRERALELLAELRLVRNKLDSMLHKDFVEQVRRVAETYASSDGFLFLGRGINYPIALEGALKLKEISYMHAEGYAAGEMKHGPIALIDPGMTIVAINSKGHVAEKVRSNIEQVKARGGVVVSVGSDEESHDLANMSLRVPDTDEWFSPLLNTIPLQLLAYSIADLRGCDIDKPRDLAKSVTVE